MEIKLADFILNTLDISLIVLFKLADFILNVLAITCVVGFIYAVLFGGV